MSQTSAAPAAELQQAGGGEPTASPRQARAFDLIPADVESEMEEQGVSADLAIEMQELGVNVVEFSCIDMQRPVVTKQGSLDSLAGKTMSAQRSTASASGNRRNLRRKSAELDEEVVEVVSFGTSRNILRASRLVTVMRNGAAIYKQSEGSASTYALSEKVDGIDVFISHNWIVSRFKKFFCLALYFNLPRAVLMAFIVMAAIVVGVSLGAPPLIEVGDEGHKHGLTATLLVCPTIVAMLCFGHEIQRFAGLRGARVFLDKTCIHQTDMELQKRGILKLGAFLRSSERMVIIYSDVYLMKLWTVYEIACFLSMHPTSNLAVIPVHVPVVFACCLARSYMAQLLWGLLQIGPILLAINFPAILGAFVAMRRWARAKEVIRQRVANFTVDQCTCYDEADRPLVGRNIAALMRATGDVDRDATEKEALDAFDDLVRRTLFTPLISSFGTYGLGYLQVVTMFICGQIAWWVDHDLLGERGSAPPDYIIRYRVVTALYSISWVGGVYPLLFVAASRWTGLCLHFSGCREWMFLALGVILVIALHEVAAIMHWYNLALESIDGSNGAMVGIVAVAVVLNFVAVVTFLGRWRFWKQEDDKESQFGASASATFSMSATASFG